MGKFLYCKYVEVVDMISYFCNGATFYLMPLASMAVVDLGGYACILSEGFISLDLVSVVIYAYNGT